MMTSRERILAVLKKEKPDMVPISPRIWAWLTEKYGRSTYLEELELKNEFDYDPIIHLGSNIPNFVYTQLGDYTKLPDVEVDISTKNADGKTYIYRKIKTLAGELSDTMVYAPEGGAYGIKPNPEKIDPLLKSKEDLEKIKYILPEPTKFIDVNYERIDKVIGDRGFLAVAPYNGVDHLLVDSMGIVNALMMYYDDHELLRQAVKVYHEYYKKCLKFALDRGAKMIFESWYNCSLSAGWSPDMYRELFLPCIIEDASITHSYGAFFSFYDDGKFMSIIDDLKKVNMDLFSTLCPPPCGDADPVVIKEKLGDTTAFNGYVDLVTLLLGTPEDVENEVRNAIEILGVNGGYILGTSDSIRNGSPYDNVKAFFEAGRKYGKY